MTLIKNAATIVLIRREGTSDYILMGQRDSKATFMPSKYVFPGGAWEDSDKYVPYARAMDKRQKELLGLQTNFLNSNTLGITAIRELWEETGLRLSSKGKFFSFPDPWRGFFSDHQGPNLSGLNFFFRAITPPGRTRRFDARFFFCDSSGIYENLDDFNEASGELTDLQWIEITRAKTLNLPIITTLVIEHLIGLMRTNRISDRIPFYSGERSGLEKKFLKL